MRRTLAAVVTALALAGAAPSVAVPAFPAPVIYVTNASSSVTPAALADALPAFQQALDQDFGPIWNAAATLQVLDPGQVAPPGSWAVTISDFSDVHGAAGYHMTCALDSPCAKVFTQEGVDWQVVFTHELFEMLADPHVDRATTPNLNGTTLYALEVGDPVERLTYTRPSASGSPVAISDFVTERWFDGAGGASSVGKYDFLGRCRRSRQVLAGGYVIKFSRGHWSAGIRRVHGRLAALLIP